MNDYGLADELNQPKAKVTLGRISINGSDDYGGKPIAFQEIFQEEIDHPSHYGGDGPLEVINIIEHYQLDFHDGNTVKYILRAGKKDELLTDLKKARWYLDRKIANLEAGND